MHLLSVQNLSKYYADKTLFDDVSFHISPADRIGIVGINGSGKTTLLKMLLALEAPDAGQILRNPKARLEYLPQNPIMDEDITILDYLFQGESPTMRLLRAYENAVLALSKSPNDSKLQDKLTQLNQKMHIENGWAAEANAKAILTKLGLTEFDTPLGQLSGGQRRRVALARALIDPADLLILDEPTNHIDPETITWLETHLSALKTALLMVTHDRYFLDRVVNTIFEIEQGQVHIYPGNYSTYLEHKAQREALRQKADLDRQKMLQRELEWIHRSPMARGGKQKARIQRAEALLENNLPQTNGPLKIDVASRRTGKQIIEIKNISKHFDGVSLIDNFSYIVNKGDKLGIIGPNGVGKSTLLNLIANRLQPDSGEIITGATIHLGYYDQEGEALDENQRVFDNISEVAKVIQTSKGEHFSAAQMLERFQFSRAVQQAYIGTLSGGERRRLYLLRTLMMAPNVLLLDEPTNDLDIQTLSILEDYLESYDGVLIIVSHDRYFLDRTVEYIFAFEEQGQIKEYPGNYSAYQAKKEQLAAKATATANKAKQKTSKSSKTSATEANKNKGRKLSYKEKQELAQLEEKVMEMEDKKETLAMQINQAGDNYQQMQTLSTKLAQLERDLDTAVERWAELAEIEEVS